MQEFKDYAESKWQSIGYDDLISLLDMINESLSYGDITFDELFTAVDEYISWQTLTGDTRLHDVLWDRCGDPITPIQIKNLYDTIEYYESKCEGE